MELQAPAQQHYLALSHMLHSVWLVIFLTCIGDREGGGGGGGGEKKNVVMLVVDK